MGNDDAILDEAAGNENRLLWRNNAAQYRFNLVSQYLSDNFEAQVAKRDGVKLGKCFRGRGFWYKD